MQHASKFTNVHWLIALSKLLEQIAFPVRSLRNLFPRALLAARCDKDNAKEVSNSSVVFRRTLYVFFFEEPIKFYSDLLYKIKEAVPYIRNVPNEKIRTAYKDITLGVFIAIPPDNDVIFHEAFRNAYDCGAETFKRLELQVREIDSPFVAKSRRESRTFSQKRERTFDSTASEQADLTKSSGRQKSQDRLFESQSADDDEFEVTNDWKKTNVESLTAEFSRN